MMRKRWHSDYEFQLISKRGVAASWIPLPILYYVTGSAGWLLLYALWAVAATVVLTRLGVRALSRWWTEHKPWQEWENSADIRERYRR